MDDRITEVLVEEGKPEKVWEKRSSINLSEWSDGETFNVLLFEKKTAAMTFSQGEKDVLSVIIGTSFLTIGGY